MEITCTK